MCANFRLGLSSFGYNWGVVRNFRKVWRAFQQFKFFEVLLPLGRCFNSITLFFCTTLNRTLEDHQILTRRSIDSNRLKYNFSKIHLFINRSAISPLSSFPFFFSTTFFSIFPFHFIPTSCSNDP